MFFTEIKIIYGNFMMLLKQIKCLLCKEPKIFLYLWLSIFLPMYAFYLLYMYYSGDFGCPSDVYVCSEVFGNFNYLILFIVSVIFTPKMFKYFWYKVLIIIAFLIYYFDACFRIAWSGCILFGNTWSESEVLRDFLLTEWSFYLFGLLGVLFHYYYQSLYYHKVNKIK